MSAPVKTSAAAPERSLDQRMDALKRANDIRTARAKLKKDLKAGKASIHALLLDPPDYVMTAKVFDMLLAVPKYGRVKANRILNQCRISPSKTIGGLSERQRTELVSPSSRSASVLSRRVARRSGQYPGSRPSCAKVFVITGPSGVGKGTLISRAAASAFPTSSSRSRRRRGSRARARRTGATTTSSRREEFERRMEADDFLEFATYSGNRYGTLRSEVERRLDGGPLGRARDRGPGRPAGARRDAGVGPDLHRPAGPRVAARAGSRVAGTDSAEAIDSRLETAESELAAQGDFDHRIVNDDLERAAAELEEIVRAEARLTSRLRAPNDQTTR